MNKRKTKAEKVRSAYRLQDFKLNLSQVQERKDSQEFGYLRKEYVRNDLLKTVLFSLIIISLLFAVKLYLF